MGTSVQVAAVNVPPYNGIRLDLVNKLAHALSLHGSLDAFDQMNALDTWLYSFDVISTVFQNLWKL